MGLRLLRPTAPVLKVHVEKLGIEIKVADFQKAKLLAGNEILRRVLKTNWFLKYYSKIFDNKVLRSFSGEPKNTTNSPSTRFQT